MEAEIALSALILILLAFLATVDMAFSQLSDISLRRLASDVEDSDSPARAVFLRQILIDRSGFRFALSLTIHILLITFAVLVTVSAIEWLSTPQEVALYSLAIALTATILFRQLIPKMIVRSDPEKRLMALLPAVRPLYTAWSWTIAPFSRFLGTGNEAVRLDATSTPESIEEAEDDAADDLQALIEVGEAEGIIEERDRELIESMVGFSDTVAGDVMTPRTEIVAISIEATVRDARDLIIEHKYSRILVYSGSIENIEGVLYVRDLLQAWANGNEMLPIKDMLRPAFFVPETKPASDLLKAMQQNHVQIAVVIDEYGGVAGVVTVEDLIEEIVGEIEDEDIEEEEIIEIIEGEDGYWDVVGSTEIDKIERLLGLDLEDEEYNTIAGLVVTEAGYVPKKGEQLVVRGLHVEVLRSDGKRIQLLRLKPDGGDENAEAAATE
ncbi:MAG: HlyC/CorC family transporter [Acidobacteria bacterium]|nr:HlyC/CorC family transporter [Acidobacteriota bacterium]